VTTSDGRRYPDDLPRHSVSAGGAVVREDGHVLNFWEDAAPGSAPPVMDSIG
jgi:hypothetical protein